MNPSASQVVIVGGGFAGLFAVRALRRAPVRVTLIDRAEHHLFQPMLYQCAVGILSEGKIATPLRDLLKRHRNAEFVLAEVTGIDTAAKKILARRLSPPSPAHRIWDVLIPVAISDRSAPKQTSR
jgi:NADH dehydrogenase